MQMKQTGLIEGNRVVIAGMPTFPSVAALLVPGSLAWYGINEEFLKGPVTDIGGLFMPPGWTGLAVGAGSLYTVANLVGGHGILTTDALDNDMLQITLGNALMGSFVVADNRDIYFEARLQHTMVGEINLGVGLTNPAAAAYLADNGGALVPTDQIMFATRDGEAALGWYASARNAGGAIAYRLLTVPRVANTTITLGFHSYGVTPNYLVDFYVNRALVAAGQAVFADIPLVPLMPFLAIKTGHAGVESLTVDYAMCAQKR